MFNLPKSLKKQSGVVLATSLIMLLLLTLISVTAMQTTCLEEKMAGNMRDKNLAFQAAESALIEAENSIDPTALPAFSATGTGGFYSSMPTPALSNSALTQANFWRDNPVATSTLTAAKLNNNITAPVYIIQQLNSVCFDPAGCIPTTTTEPLPMYKITVKATGGSTNSVVILQSTISTPAP